MIAGRNAISMAALGAAAGLGTVDLVGIEPDLPVIVIPIAISMAALVSVIATPPTRRIDPAAMRLIVVFGGWVAWSLVSAVGSPGPLLAATTSAGFALTLMAGVGLATGSQSSAMFVVAAVATFVHGVAAMVIALVADIDEYSTRLSLVELEPNHLARLLALVVLVSVLWSLEHSMRRWVPALALSAVCLGGVLLTGSRTASAALVGAGICGLVAARRWSLLVAAFVALAATSALILATGFGSEIASLTNRSSDELSAIDGATGRTTLWRELVEVIDEHPVAGIGLGADRARVLEVSDDAGFTWSPQHAHNLVLHLALTTGWVGAVLFGAGLALALGTAVTRGSPWLAAIVAFVLIDGVSEPVVRLPELTWVILAMGLVAGFATSGEPARRPVGAALARSGVAATLALSMAIGLVWFEPGGYPHRYRCRDEPVLADDGLLVDLDPSGGRFRTTSDTVAAPVVGDVLTFDGTTAPLLLPGSTARSVRCGALRTGAITVVVSVSVDDLGATGPGRIITISSGTEWNDIDLHLGQEADGLSVRVRQSEFRRIDHVVPGAFTDTDRHEFVLMIERSRIRVWRDGVPIDDRSDFRPIEFYAWPTDRPAALGNEMTSDRPFAGTVASVRIYEGRRLEGLAAD